MPQFQMRVAALIQTFEDDSRLAEAFYFPDVSCYSFHTVQLRQLLSRRVRELLKATPASQLYRYQFAELPEPRSLEVALPPNRSDHTRVHPVNLTLHYVRWQHHRDGSLAYFPALGIVVMAADDEQLERELLPEVRSALARRKSSESLRDLIWLAQRKQISVKRMLFRLKLPTLKQAAKKEEEFAEAEKSILKQVATDLRKKPGPIVYQRDEVVDRLFELLTARQPRSVLLVGPSGAGKTAIVAAVARRLLTPPYNDIPIWSTSGSRLIAGMSGFGMWQLRVFKLVLEASKTDAIVHVDNLVELAEVGKGGCSTQGIAAVLAPSITRGAFLAIAECTAEQLALLEREEPQLLDAFVQLEVPETTPEKTRDILASCASLYQEEDSTKAITQEGLETLDRLHRRYATYSASPGRQIRFLRNLLEDRAATETIRSTEVTAAFSQETGLPLFMLEDTIPLDLEATRAWFSKHVIGQAAPVDRVVDVLASVKAGLNRLSKPIASLLFIGPTGVGKTAMAKALAEFLYQDAGRIIRFDMSEYSLPAAIERLIGGYGRAQGLLTQKVRDQPFMVLLLDEFEKAHPLFFDVLLQVLGEGRLTDSSGRVANFTNTVVIMTSNLGAESFRNAALGFSSTGDISISAERHFEREVRAMLRPEMFNRLDSIVPFAPLDRATISAIAQRELDNITRRNGILLRGITLVVEPEVVEHLAATGFDLRYGARPLKRAIERAVVAPLAERLCQFKRTSISDCHVRLTDEGLSIDAMATTAGRQGDDHVMAPAEVTRVRRHVQLLHGSGVVLRLRNEIFRLRQAERQRLRALKRRGKRAAYRFTPQQAQLLAQEQILDRVDDLLRDVSVLEDEALGGLYAQQPMTESAILARLVPLENELRNILFELFRRQTMERGFLSVAIFGISKPHVLALCAAYDAICSIYPVTVHHYWLKIYNPQLDTASRGSQVNRTSLPIPVMQLKSRKEHSEAAQKKVVDVFVPPADRFENPPDDVIGVALQLRGDRAAALLEAESGRHDFVLSPQQQATCFVETHPNILASYTPPADVGRAGAMKEFVLRRTYDTARETCHDYLLQKVFRLQARSLNTVIAEAAAEQLAKRTWSLLD